MNPAIRRSYVGALVAIASASVGRAASEPPTRPSQQARGVVGAEARAALGPLLADPSALRLSTDKKSADRFQFELALAMPTAGGRALTSRYIVARDGGDLAALVLTADGKPFAYTTKGLWIGFDPAQRGHMVALDMGAPRLIFGLGENGHSLDFELSHVRRAEVPELRVDIASLLKGAIEEAQEGSFDPAEQLVRLTTNKSTVSVGISARAGKNDFPVSRLVIRSKAGATVTLSDVKVGGDRPAMLGVARAAFEKAGLPVRALGDTESPKVPLFAPPGFGSSKMEREAAERMSSIFPSARHTRGGAATREGAPAVDASPETPRQN